MRSTNSTTSSVSSQNNNDRRALLETYITTYTLMTITALLVLMLLIWHTSITHTIKDFQMPPGWETNFEKQQMGGLKLVVWVVVLVFVPLDAVHAMLCLGHYHGQLSKADTATDRAHRSDDPNVSTTQDKKRRHFDDRNETSTSCSARESQVPPRDDHRGLPSIGAQNSTPPSPTTKPHTCRSLLVHHFTSTEHLLLLTIWNGLLITILSLHVFSFFSNIAPSIAFCNTAAALHDPSRAFHDTQADRIQGRRAVPQLDMRERCERINWNIHSAGGFSSAGAALLAALHLFIIVLNARDSARWAWRQWTNSGAEEDKGGKQLALEHWKHGSRNVDTLVRGISSSTESGSQPTGHATTISEEEQNTGIRQRREPVQRVRKNTAAGKPVSMWGEALLECLVP